ncbi:MAG: hypothetical protein WCO23_03675 [bacterium]
MDKLALVPTLESKISDLLQGLMDKNKPNIEKSIIIGTICQYEGADGILLDFFYTEQDLSKKIVIATALLAYDNGLSMRSFIYANRDNDEVRDLVARMSCLVPTQTPSERKKIEFPFNLCFIIKLWRISEQKDANGHKARCILGELHVSKRAGVYYYRNRQIC